MQNVNLLAFVAHSVQAVQYNMLRLLAPGLAGFSLEEGHLTHNNSSKGCTKLLNSVKHKDWFTMFCLIYYVLSGLLCSVLKVMRYSFQTFFLLIKLPCHVL
jgi:hypothetical protein